MIFFRRIHLLLFLICQKNLIFLFSDIFRLVKYIFSFPSCTSYTRDWSSFRNKLCKGTVSNIYKTPFSFIMQLGFSPLSKIMQNWESDHHVFADEEWSKALSRVHTLLHREYWTKAKLSKIYPGFDPNCASVDNLQLLFIILFTINVLF